MILLLLTKQIILALGFEAEVAHAAQMYINLSLPKAYLVGIFDLTKLYMSCFKGVLPVIAAQISAILLQIACLELLVTKSELGIDGIAYSSVITSLTLVLSVLIYARYVKPETRQSFLLSKE